MRGCLRILLYLLWYPACFQRFLLERHLTDFIAQRVISSFLAFVVAVVFSWSPLLCLAQLLDSETISARGSPLVIIFAAYYFSGLV